MEEATEEELYYLDIEWQHHPLRAFLFKKLCQGRIPVDHNEMKPFDVWNTFCDDPVFEGLEYDATFVSRLYGLRKIFKKGKDRADDDLKAFEIAKVNHPVPALNHRGEPQWNGSAAQKLLEQDMKEKKHFDLKPEHLWETRPEYQQFHLTTFRDHIHQAHQTAKYIYTLEMRTLEKAEKRKQQAIEKKRQEKEKHEKEKERAARKAAKEEEKKKKAEEKAAAKAKKDVEKAAAKAKKGADRAAAKAKKDAEKGAKRAAAAAKKGN